MSLRVEEIEDLDVAKQVAQLALAENRRLYKRLEAQAKRIAELTGKNGGKELQLELLHIKESMAALQRQLYGPLSERRRGEGQETGRDGDAAPPKSPPAPPSERRRQTELRLVPQVHELEGDALVCPSCGRNRVEWRVQQETTEEVDVVRREFVLRRHVRTKYRCACGSAPALAPRTPALPGGGRYSLGFAVEVAVSKYADHAPLERQVRIMRREGLDITSSTLWEQIERLARVLVGTYGALRAQVLAGGLVRADETTWRMLKKGSMKWWVWSISSHDAVYYRVDPSRGHKVIVEMLEGFEGTLVVDGYRAYQTALKVMDGVSLAYCWSHARRALLEAEASYPEASEALDLITELFLIERDLPDWRVITDAALREQVLAQIRHTRRERSRPLVEALAAWAKAQQALPQSRLGKAIAYLDTYWDGLCRFLSDPHVPLSNNRAERAVRGPVLGRKNHLGSKSLRGTEVAALFYTLTESAKLAGVDPHAYAIAAAHAALRGESPLLPHVYRMQLKATP